MKIRTASPGWAPCIPRLPFCLPAALVLAGTMMAPPPASSQNAGSDGSLPSSTSDTYHFHGVVLDSHTQKPVSRALVQAYGDQIATMTDHDGRFTLDVHITSTAQGTAGRQGALLARMLYPSITARKPGYMTDITGRLPQVVPPDQMDRDIVLKLTPESAIQGRVVATGDDHPEGVRVALYTRHIQDGMGRWAATGMSVTNSQGEFRFGGLAAGEYRIMTQVWSDEPGQPPPNKPAQRYAPVSFPAGSSGTTGPEIHLAAGETLPVNLNLHPETFYPIRIPVEMSTGSFGVQARVERGGAAFGLDLRYNARDKAVEGLLPGGSYQVSLQGVGPTSASAATVSLTVGGGAVETAPVALTPLASIPVIVHQDFTGGGASRAVQAPFGNGPQVQVILQPEDPTVQVGVMTTGRDGLQSPVVERVQPGTYRVQITAQRGYVAAASSGGTDLLHAPLTVGPGSSAAPIEITLRDDSGRIDGELDSSLLSPEDTGNIASTRMYLLCLPAEPSNLQAIQSMARPNGRFVFNNVPPGSYRVYASRAPLNNVEYRSEAFLKASGGKGALVTVNAGSAASVTVTALLEAEER